MDFGIFEYPGTNVPWKPGTTVLEESKVIHRILTVLWEEPVPLNSMLFKGPLYLHLGKRNQGLELTGGARGEHKTQLTIKAWEPGHWLGNMGPYSVPRSGIKYLSGSLEPGERSFFPQLTQYLDHISATKPFFTNKYMQVILHIILPRARA